MNKQSRRMAVSAIALMIALSVVGSACAGALMGTSAGVGGSPPTGPFVVEPNAMGMGPGVIVMNPPGPNNPMGEIPIYIDPTGDPWLKRIVITPNSFPQPVLTTGQVIPVWEKIRILPPPPTAGIPRLPFTDWHEQIVDIVSPIPDINFIWGAGELIIHGPGDPGTIPPPLPLVVAPGMVDPLDPRGIWFGPWSPAPPIGPNGLPVWIHKQLIYQGPTITLPGEIEIFIREWPTTPEPTTLVLAGLGCVTAVGVRRRRRMS